MFGVLAWGCPPRQPTEDTDDWKTAEGAANFLARKHDKPFFLASGSMVGDRNG